MPSSDTSNLYQVSSDEPSHQSITPRRTSRAVSFSPNVHVKRTLHINNYSDEEIHATWLDESDFQRIRGEIDLTVHLMETGGHIESDKQCTRGLESRTTVGALRKLQNKQDARDAVLFEQETQWNRGINDAETISDVYQERSHSCGVSAHIVGLFDEKMTRGLDARAGKRRYKQTKDSVVRRAFLDTRRRVM